MSKPSQFIVLAEDEIQQRFIRRFLQKLYDSPSIRNRDLPNSKGSGEQWVREQYAQEVKAYRNRSARAKTALIVAIDADTSEVSQRCRQLRETLKAADERPRTNEETIVHLIPKRNIETWIFCLNGKAVDETTDYSRRDVDGLIIDAASSFFDWTRSQATLPSHCVPSLVEAIPEANRLNQLHR